ncbi:hypothetical protein L208DRAFT_72990 [Tricholoma matsutake]|nr:hypothetical protein L208DRAFT_72990 [Tricholoma matsutake 945]
MVSSADVQRLFLQGIFSRGILSERLAQALWRKCIDAVKAADNSIELPQATGKANWDAFVVKVNKSLDNLDLEFRHVLDENSGTEMYAVVNRKGDEIAQIATDYTPGEIAYFKAIIEQIMLAPHESFSVSSLAALREVNAIQPKSNMSKTQAEVVLGSFVAKGWLLKSKRGRYSLSTRSLLELHSYLKTTYPDEVLECTICLEIVTRGIACHTKNCKTRMHHHCFINFRRRHSVCPSCGQDWPSEAHEKPLLPVGEGAVRDGDDGRRRVRIRSTEASEDDEPTEDEPTSTQLQRKSQRSKNGKALVNESMVMDEDEENGTPEASQKRRRSSRK